MNLVRWFLALLIVTARLAVAQPTVPEGGAVIARYGDWKVVCAPPPPGAKHDICAVMQSVTAEDRDKISLSITIEKLSDGKLFLRALAPLGVLLPPGLGLKIDDVDVGQAPFVRCHASGCYAQMVVAGTLAQQLRTGKTAVFSIFQKAEAGVGLPISLSGFSQALATFQAMPLSFRQ